jgi:hypothetical protein
MFIAIVKMLKESLSLGPAYGKNPFNKRIERRIISGNTCYMINVIFENIRVLK